MDNTASLKTDMRLVEHFEVQGTLRNTDLTLELGRFHSNSGISTGSFEFIVGGVIYDETKPNQPLLATFNQVIRIPILKIYGKTLQLTANDLDIQFKKDCSEEEKNLINKHLNLYIVHES